MYDTLLVLSIRLSITYAVMASVIPYDVKEKLKAFLKLKTDKSLPTGKMLKRVQLNGLNNKLADVLECAHHAAAEGKTSVRVDYYHSAVRNPITRLVPQSLQMFLYVILWNRIHGLRLQ